jgi:hypothetical protein
MIHFLSGLPRSGSTVLAAVLNQHPSIRVSATSGLPDVMGAIIRANETTGTFVAAGSPQDETFDILRGVLEVMRARGGKSVYIDKSRLWPNPGIMDTMSNVLGRKPRIIATVRNIADCAASFVRVAKPQDVRTFLRAPGGPIHHLRGAYAQLAAGYAAKPDNFCIVEYDQLMDLPLQTLRRIEEFIGVAPHDYDLQNIDPRVVAENDDAAWGIPGLHDIKPQLKRTSTDDSRAILGVDYGSFLQPRFWRGETMENRPRQPIDLQMEANLRGDFDKAKAIGKKILDATPDNDRVAFNYGWNLLADGKLKEGLGYIHRGRWEGVFGNPAPTQAPIWDGKGSQTVLLNLEGGLGDQIHGARYAADIQRRGCDVILAADQSLIPVLRKCPGVTAAVTRNAAEFVYHDCWLPSMSAPLVLDWEWKDVAGGAYVPSAHRRSQRLRIGLRWQGNPRFEEEQLRLFDPRLLFRAVENADAEFVSLQRDVGADARPSFAKPVPLDTWEQTCGVIAGCDLVISSCTSVAHMAGAMGIPTWIIVPIMPYYLWALPGRRTPWYDSVTLYRQEKFGDWRAPFEKIKRDIRRLKSSPSMLISKGE